MDIYKLKKEYEEIRKKIIKEENRIFPPLKPKKDVDFSKLREIAQYYINERWSGSAPNKQVFERAVFLEVIQAIYGLHAFETMNNLTF